MIGETILHYKILEKLGEGGMGKVYKAKDTKLDRFVALKFLPSQLTASEDDKARFIQEAKAASAMNHPNVCTIHDIQNYENQLFIVMEFVDGKTLKDKKDSLSEKQNLEIGIQVAEGLAAAHEKGIVHRDIKPENIMVRKDGIVQIMDFGLAKLYKESNVSRLTKAGSTVGTIGYMSPEQVQGLDVDHRTDIFSLGVVLYELLSGEAPFKGMHETAIMYEIVNVDPPPISTVKEGIDPQLDYIILECLEKDKDDRCQSAKELAKDLRKIKKSAGQRKSRVFNVNPSAVNISTDGIPAYNKSGVTTPQDIPVKSFLNSILYNPKLSWSLGFLFFAATILLLVFSVLNKTKTEVQEVKSMIIQPYDITFDNRRGSNLTISPNGQFVAFVATNAAGTDNLWVRPINSLTARALTDVTNIAYPFWSPDSKTIAYFDNGKLMKISLGSGSPLPICDAPDGRGGSWSSNGTIVFSPNGYDGIYKVHSSGGNPEEIIKTDTSFQIQSLRYAYFLPDGNHFLYSTKNRVGGSTPNDGIYVASLDNNMPVKLISASSNCQYADGYLLFVDQSILVAQKFNPDKLKIEGEAMPVADNVQYFDAALSGTFAVSQNGRLVYIQGNTNVQNLALLYINRNSIRKISDVVPSNSASFSRDGSKIVSDLYDPGERRSDVWVYDINRNVWTRLTFDGNNIVANWTPDGKQITYISNANSPNMMPYIKNADGSGEAESLFESNYSVNDISLDGKYYLMGAINYISSFSGFDLILTVKGDEDPVTILAATNFNEGFASFSPNMKWIAYNSDESGIAQIYIIPFDPNNTSGISARWQISVDGGERAKWMNNGKSIYFITPDNKIIGVDVNESGSSLSPDKPYLVFDPQFTTVTNIYDISNDGTEIIATIPRAENTQAGIILVQNWHKEVENDQ
ncbi:MAG: protein kinase [Ignavibacteriaceae bacterium]